MQLAFSSVTQQEKHQWPKRPKLTAVQSIGQQVMQMSNEREDSRFPPLASTESVGDANYPRARFDDGFGFVIKDMARCRAPGTRTEHRHRAGVASELAVSGYEGDPINDEVYPDYQGDDGWDLEITRFGTRYTAEVKCVCTGSLELRVQEDRVDDVDYFYLCRTQAPTAMVEILGYIDRNGVQKWGESHPDDDLIRVRPRYLFPLEPTLITSDDIREAQVQPVRPA